MANKLYVGGLSYDTADEELKTFFEQAGTVESATVITDRDSGRSKGFGFVEMSTPSETQRAIAELNGKTLGDRAIRVEEARPARRDGDGSGGRPRGSGYGSRTVVDSWSDSGPHVDGLGSVDHVHHWLIGKQDGPVSEAVGKRCGARRNFSPDRLSPRSRQGCTLRAHAQTLNA